MKKCIPYSNYIVAAAGIAAALLRKWLLTGGTDDKGLYPAAHPGWIGYLLLSIVTLAFIWAVTRQEKNNPNWNANFTGGILPAASYVLCAIGMGLYSYTLLSETFMLVSLVRLWGFASAAVMLVLGWLRYHGRTSNTVLPLIPSLFFALQLISLTGRFGSDPELLRFLPTIFASASTALACYQMWGFSVDYGSRKSCLFWSLSAAYFCFAAAPSDHVMYITLGLWHLLSHPMLTLSPAVEPEEDVFDESYEEIFTENEEM